ncbi:Uncharacterised protein [Mycobacterium tuberculosis]|nr:Uncharacterised protein [Mycobacterium tuberculosis]
MLRFGFVLRFATQKNHVRCKLQAKLRELSRTSPFQRLYGLAHLQSVADGRTERFIHIRDQRNRFAANLRADIYHRLC